MKKLGYSLNKTEPDKNSIVGFEEPFEITRSDLPKNYSTIEKNKVDELKRIDMLLDNSKANRNIIPQYFYSNKAYLRLKQFL